MPLRKALPSEADWSLPRGPSLRLLIENVKAGLLDEDALFDRIYPPAARRLSTIHWTPVRVARRAAQLLTEGRRSVRVLDVGSGVGKFCIVGALTSSAVFVGVEQRARFVDLASEIIRHYRIPRVRFIHGDFRNLDWSEYNSVYLFNPFQENLPKSEIIDNAVDRLPQLYRIYIDETVSKLKTLPSGSRVATYWGFGGKFPRNYERIFKETVYRGILEVWEKTR